MPVPWWLVKASLLLKAVNHFYLNTQLERYALLSPTLGRGALLALAGALLYFCYGDTRETQLCCLPKTQKPKRPQKQRIIMRPGVCCGVRLEDSECIGIPEEYCQRPRNKKAEQHTFVLIMARPFVRNGEAGKDTSSPHIYAGCIC